MLFSTVFLISLCFSGIAIAQEKERFLALSWGDVIYGRTGVAKLDTPEKILEATRNWKNNGVDKVLFRVDDFRTILFHDLHVDETEPYLREWVKVTKRAWKDGLLQTAVDALKSAGIEVFMWIAPTDEGRPPDVVLFDFGGGATPTFWPWHSKFTKENPQYLVHNRTLTTNQRKYQWHVMEYAYPAVRSYMINKIIRAFSDRFDFDGVFLSIRSHGPPPEYADEYGFNQPIVKEYKRRYGRDIIREDFDVTKWRELRGEYFTLFLKELKAHLDTTGQKLSIGVQQGEHFGPPFGNMSLQWRRWVSEGIIDELVLGHITRVRSRYPAHSQRTWGYVQNQESGLGLPPVTEAIRKDYGPLCKRHGVKLYVEPSNFYRVYGHPAVGRGKGVPEKTLEQLRSELKTIPEITGLPVGYMEVTQKGK